MRIPSEKIRVARYTHSSFQLMLYLLPTYIKHWQRTDAKILDYLQLTNVLESEMVINTLLFVLSLPGLVIFSK